MSSNAAMEMLDKTIYSLIANEDSMLEKMDLTKTLQPDTEADKTLCWTFDGRHLLSASNNSVVRVWSLDGTLVYSQKLESNGSINSLKQLPDSGKTSLAYCDRTGNVFLQDLSSEKANACSLPYSAKKIATAQADPHSIFCFCEGTDVHLYDVRCASASTLLSNVNAQSTSFDVCSGRPELIAIGYKNGEVQIYDTRQQSRPFKTLSTAENMLKRMRKFISSVKNIRFNDYGTELIMNDLYGICYLFNLNDDNYTLDRKLLNMPIGVKCVAKMEEEQNECLVSCDQIIWEMQSYMKQKRYSKALKVGYQGLISEKITDNINKSTVKHCRSMCFWQRNWELDRYMCLREIIECYELNQNNCHILYDLIRYLAIFGQFTLARALIKRYKNTFPRSEGPSITSLELQIILEESKNQLEYFDPQNIPSFIDFKQCYQGLNNLSVTGRNAYFFGTNQQYIVVPTMQSSFVVYDKKTGLVKIAISHDKADEMFDALPNPERPIIATSHREGIIRVWEPSATNNQSIHRIDDNFDFESFFNFRVDKHECDDIQKQLKNPSREGDCRIS